MRGRIYRHTHQPCPSLLILHSLVLAWLLHSIVETIAEPPKRMTTVTNPINLPHQPVPWTNARNWAANPAATPSALTGKNTASIAPQNTVAPTWRDALDAINPLHQIPVVGEIYRGITGEKISGIARVAGGFIFGGIAGGLAAAMVAAYAEGHDDQGPGEQLVAALAQDKGASAAAPAATHSGAAPTTAVAAKTGTGLPTDDIPTVTITAQDAANLQLPSQPVFARQPAPETAAELTRSAEKTLASEGKTSVAAQDSIIPEVYTPPPLRDKLNAKRPTPGFSAAPRPLNLSSFIDRLPAQAASLSLNQPDNLALLQEVNAVPNPGTSTPPAGAALTPNARSQTTQNGGRNPLPPELVRDMMLQALDKYQKLPEVVAEAVQ